MRRTLLNRNLSRICESLVQKFQGNGDEGYRRFPWLIILSGIWLSVCLFGMSGAVPCCAEETLQKNDEEIIEEIKEECDSIVHIESICWDGESVIYGTKSFSGVVVTKDTAGIYIVTVQNGLAWTTEEKEAIRTQYELESTVRVSDKIEVVFEGDLRIEATVTGESEQRNLSVLKLSQTAQFENILPFSEENTTENEKIILLSFPSSVGDTGAAYNYENISAVEGTVLQLYRENGNIFIKHNILTDADSIGGPILNTEGMIVGILLTADKDGGTAVSSETIKAFLDTFEISYEEPEPETEPKRISVLNLILGIVAGLLFLIVLQREWKSRVTLKSREDREASLIKGGSANGYGKKWRKPKEDGTARSMGRSAEKRLNTEKIPEARLDYPGAKRAVVISKSIFVIGRVEEADFSLPDRRDISRRHACIQYVGGNFFLTDLHSVNHTFLNGQQLMPNEKYVLNDGDEIVLAKEQMHFYYQKQ